MLSQILRESGWPSNYDDLEIDDIIWSEIESSPSSSDFVCYLVHRLSKARHRDAALARSASADESESAAPVGYPRAVERIRLLAESGNAAAMFHMGKISALGIATAQDLAAARFWYEKAIDHGEMRAHCNMGWLYQSGYGVPEDKEKAFHLLSIGADSGVPTARASVGMMLVTGEGCTSNPSLGLRMMQDAFDAGYNNAGNHLSDLFFAGKYVPQDIGLAHDWLFKVVARSDERTMAILGHYLITGSHGKIDVAQGLALLDESIEKCYFPGCLWLGNLYKNGQGVERNLQKAKALFEKGAAAGDAGCEFALASLLHETDHAPAPGSSSVQ